MTGHERILIDPMNENKDPSMHKGENYFLADISPGKLGPDQAAPRRELY